MPIAVTSIGQYQSRALGYAAFRQISIKHKRIYPCYPISVIPHPTQCGYRRGMCGFSLMNQRFLDAHVNENLYRFR